MSSDEAGPVFRVAALYKFRKIDDVEALRRGLAALCCANGIRGTLILAAEGINGTVAGRPAAIETLLSALADAVGVGSGDVKFSEAAEMPFHRMKVRAKREIVTMGVADIDPRRDAGAYVEPTDWNALMADPDTVVVDTRNDYEVRLGTFRGAIDPGTRSFRDFPAWVAANRDRLEGKKIAMFCTGGIRCEKATALMRREGLEEVYHLKNGILGYLEAVPAEESLWQGECFVFDERVAVVLGLQQGDAQLCRACRRPLTAEDRLSALFVEGVRCGYCHDERSAADRERYAERHRQVERHRQQGRNHIGSAPAKVEGQAEGG